MLDSLRPYLARVLAALIAAGIGAIATKLGIEATSIDQAALSNSLATFLALVIYGVAHKALDKKINPADSASTHLAVAGKVDAAQMKAAETARQNY